MTTTMERETREAPQTDERINDLDALLMALDGGRASVEVNKKLREVLDALRETAEETGTAKAGLTVSITFAQEGRGGKTVVAYSVSGKLPDVPRERTTLFATAAGLSVNDPRQVEMFGGRRVKSARRNEKE